MLHRGEHTGGLTDASTVEGCDPALGAFHLLRDQFMSCAGFRPSPRQMPEKSNKRALPCRECPAIPRLVPVHDCRTRGPWRTVVIPAPKSAANPQNRGAPGPRPALASLSVVDREALHLSTNARHPRRSKRDET